MGESQLYTTTVHLLNVRINLKQRLLIPLVSGDDIQQPWQKQPSTLETCTDSLQIRAPI